MKLVYEEYHNHLGGSFEDGRKSVLPYNRCVKPPSSTYFNGNWIAQTLVQYFEDVLDPTPEEITMFALEFGEESTEAYLKFLKSGAK